MVSHMHYMLPHFVNLMADGSDAAFRPGGAVSRAADWDRIAPFPFDNYLTRYVYMCVCNRWCAATACARHPRIHQRAAKFRCAVRCWHCHS